MCRWNGCTQPPPPLRISQRLKLPFFCWASGVRPAWFFRLASTCCGSKGLPLISHSVSPPARAALHLEDQPVVQHGLPVARQRRELTHHSGRDHAVVGSVVADDELQHRDLVVRVRREPGRVGPHPAVGHLHHVGQVDDVALGGGGAVLVPGEVDDHLAPLGRPQLEGVALDRERQQPAVGGDLGELHALLAVRDAVLALEFVARVAERHRRSSGPWWSSSA